MVLPDSISAAVSVSPVSTAQAHFGREEAKKLLQDFVDQFDVPTTTLPEIDLRPEDAAPPAEKAEILAARQHAEMAGVLLLIARLPDGTLYYYESLAEFPRSFLPEHVRTHLTEHDWEVFQVAMQVASIRRAIARLMKFKQPNQATDPTTPSDRGSP